MRTRKYDVFLSYNSEDRSEVTVIERLLSKRGIRCWIDFEELRPGIPWQRALEKQIPVISSAAVFVGRKGFGPWQDMEIDAFLREFVRRQCPVIPVLLPTSVKRPRNLPPFLKGMTWVDFRLGEAHGIDHLHWGITGERPFKEIVTIENGNALVTATKPRAPSVRHTSTRGNA